MSKKHKSGHKKPKPTRKCRQYDVEEMGKAAEAVKSGMMTLRKAAELFKVPRSTLSETLRGKRQLEMHWGRKTQLPQEEEARLAEHCKERAAKGLGFSTSDVRVTAAKLGEKLGKPFKKSTASTRWLQFFRVRHGLTLRTPEATPAYRHMGINVERVAKFFTELTQLCNGGY